MADIHSLDRHRHEVEMQAKSPIKHPKRILTEIMSETEQSTRRSSKAFAREAEEANRDIFDDEGSARGLYSAESALNPPKLHVEIAVRDADVVTGERFQHKAEPVDTREAMQKAHAVNVERLPIERNRKLKPTSGT